VASDVSWWEDPAADWGQGEPARAVELFARLYPDEADARRVVDAIGLPWSGAAGSASTRWRSVFEAAAAASDRNPVDLAAYLLFDREKDQVQVRDPLVRLLGDRLPYAHSLGAVRYGRDAVPPAPPLGGEPLEAMTSRAAGFSDADAYFRALEDHRRRTAKLNRGNEALGTGVLIGPDLLLTAAHVLRYDGWPPSEPLGMQAVFDFAGSQRRSVAETGVSVGVTKLEFGVPPLPAERAGDVAVGAGAPMTNLDFAVVRLQRRIGDEPAGAGRGFYPLNTNDYAFSGRPMRIVHHPAGALATISDLVGDVSATVDRTRMDYLTNTLPGSSGCPIVDADGALVGIHHAGPKSGGRGVPFRTISTVLDAECPDLFTDPAALPAAQPGHSDPVTPFVATVVAADPFVDQDPLRQALRTMSKRNGRRHLAISGATELGKSHALVFLTHVAAESVSCQELLDEAAGGLRVIVVDLRDFSALPLDDQFLEVGRYLLEEADLWTDADDTVQRARHAVSIANSLRSRIRRSDQQWWICFDSIDHPEALVQSRLHELINAVAGLTRDLQLQVRVVLGGQRARVPQRSCEQDPVGRPRDPDRGVVPRTCRGMGAVARGAGRTAAGAGRPRSHARRLRHGRAAADRGRARDVPTRWVASSRRGRRVAGVPGERERRGRLMAGSSAQARLENVRRRRQLVHSPLVERLALLAEFDPDRIDDPDAAEVVGQLCANVERPAQPARRVLRPRTRVDAYVAMLQRDGVSGLVAARATTTTHADTPLQRMLDVFTRQESLPADGLDDDELLAALQVWRWATEAAARARTTDSVRVPFDRDVIEGRLARLDATRAVRTLARGGCVGRDRELAQLREYVDASASAVGLVDDPAMVVHGIGGVGKSKLIACFVERLTTEDGRGFPGAWTYLDMDRPTLRSYETTAILDEILRQVAAQFPEARRRLEGVRRDVRQRSKGAGLESLDAPVPYAAAEELASSVHQLGDGRLVAILDTFEEVTLAEPQRPAQIFDLFAMLSRELRLKLIVVGRAPAEPFAQASTRILPVRNFSGDAAVELLQHFLATRHGVDDVDDALARDVVDTVGGNPLTVQLAADILATEGWAGVDEATRGIAVERVRQGFIRGFLYRRILEHVEASDPAATPELRAAAKAALVLRRLTPPLLADVVLPELGGTVEHDASWFYAELAREVAFVERHTDHLRLREELRGPALLAVGYEDRPMVDRIHRAAASYYGTHPEEPHAVDERAYHLLALGTPAVDLGLDQATIASLAGSVPSLPDGVAADLTALRDASDLDVSPERDQLAWERRVGSQAESALLSDRLDEARRLLTERSARRPTTELYRLESRLHEAEGHLAEALHLSRHDTGASHLAGDRVRYAAGAVRTAKLEEQLGRGDAADTLRDAADAALLAGDHALRLELHLNRFATLERTGRLDDDQRWSLELDARALLARLPPADVADNTALVKLLAATLGRDQLTLLRFAVGTIGLGPDEDPTRVHRLAAAIDDWDRARRPPGRLARAAGLGTTEPVGTSTWISALAGLGDEAGSRLDSMWTVEEPPPPVREALRAFYLWWDIPSAPRDEPGAGSHVLDQPLDFNRPEAQRLHRVIVDGYGDPESLLSLADRAGVDPGSVDLAGSPDAIVRDFLVQADRSGALRDVVSAVLADPAAGTLRDLLTDLVDPPAEQ
jgi:hypothetical protein